MFSIRHIALASVAGLALTVAIPGCQPERPDVIPSSAQMSISGDGMIHYTAPHDGMVYVYDQSQNRLVWSGNAVKGTAVDVDPQTNRIVVGGTVRANKVLVGHDRVDIYFDEAPTPASPPPQTWNNNSNNNGVTVTPNVTVQPANGQNQSGGVTVQPGVNVTPTPAPTQPQQ